MRKTIQCGRCDAKVDMEEGLRIKTCFSIVGETKKAYGHQIEVDDKTAAGAAIVAHIEKKPVAVLRALKLRERDRRESTKATS